MRILVLAFILLGAALGGYTYWQHPAESAQLAQDIRALISSATASASNSSAADSPAVLASDHATASAPDQTAPAVPLPAPLKPWIPPAVLPAQPDWTWKTSDGKVYHEVKIIRIDASCVTILHADGGGRVPLATLPPDMQKYFNYDPVAAAQAEQQYQAGVAQENAEATKIADETADAKPAPVDPHAVSAPVNQYSVTDDYADAVTEAKADKKLLLLHFTGSDWCPYCKLMDQEVLSTAAFHDFSAANFVIVTLDFPRSFELSSDLKQQNDSLNQKYQVTGFPTLVVTDPDGNEKTRFVGYQPGSGPDPILAQMKQSCQR